MQEFSYEDYLSDLNIDDLARIVFTLLTEVWVLRDRNTILEHLLTAKGCLNTGQIDEFTPDQELSAELEKMRDRMVTTVLGSPLHKGRPKSVEEILKLADPN